MEDLLKAKIQTEALVAFRKAKGVGTVVLDTGSGKSKVAIDFMRTQDDVLKVLITSPRTNLQKNWSDELIKWGFEPWRDGKWGINYDGEKPSKMLDITIENIQTA